MKIATILLAVTIAGAGAGGYAIGRVTRHQVPCTASHPVMAPSFHDLRINPAGDYVKLVNPSQPDIVKLAGELKTFEKAYRFVHDEIKFAPFAPPGPVNKTLEYRTGSCLGKAALLASLYRAMGMSVQDVRLVMGVVMTPAGPSDHVWLDLEHQGQCLQQDPSGMLGSFAFNEFSGTRYADTYVIKESFCFNDRDFAIVSQLNRMRGRF